MRSGDPQDASGRIVVTILERDMKSKGLSVLGYVQELLLRRYEALRDEPEKPASKGAHRRDQRPR